MPEFPEVNRQVAYLREHCTGVELSGFAIASRCRSFRDIAPRSRARVLRGYFVGNRIDAVHQRGKFIVFDTAQGPLLSHLMYAGRWALGDAPFISNYKHHQRPPKNSGLILSLHLRDGRQLNFYDPQNLATLRVYPGEELASLLDLSELGPEPLRTALSLPGSKLWTLSNFSREAGGSRQAIGDYLADQRRLSGLGRTYVREALIAAAIRPERRANELSPDELRRIHDSVKHLLRRAIASELDYDAVFPSRGRSVRSKAKVPRPAARTTARAGRTST